MLDPAPLLAASILSIEARTYLHAGIKEQQVRQSFGWSMTRYAQRLNTLIDSELALQIDSVTTRRLQRVRESRQRSRSLRSA